MAELNRQITQTGRRFAVAAWGLGLWIGLSLQACSMDSSMEEAEDAYARGDIPEAVAFFRQALEEEETPEVPRAHVRTRLATALRRQGSLTEAGVQLELAIEEAERTGADGLKASAHLNLAAVRARQRDGTALEHAQSALNFYERHGTARDRMLAHIFVAGAYFTRNEFDRAHKHYRQSLDTARALGDVWREAASLEGLAMVLGFAGEFDLAIGRYSEAARLYDKAGRKIELAHIVGNMAFDLLNGRQLERAAEVARRLMELGEQRGNDIDQLQALCLLAEVSFLQGKREESLAFFKQYWVIRGDAACQFDGAALVMEGLVLAELGRWDEVGQRLARAETEENLADHVRARMHALGARLATARGQPERAIESYMASVRDYERLRVQLGTQFTARYFTRVRLEAYEGLLRLLLDLDRDEEAATVVGLIKSRALLDDLLRRRGGQVEAGAATSRTVERGANLGRITLASAALQPVSPAGWSVPPSLLPEDLAIIEYYALEDELIVLWRVRGKLRVKRVPVGRRELWTWADDAEGTLIRRRYDYTETIRALSVALLEPLREELEDPWHPPTICVIPHGPLHRVPFEILPWGEGLLIDAFDVGYAPSLPSLAEILGSSSGFHRPDRLLAVGNVGGDLPGAYGEVKALQQLYERSVALVGPDATEGTVRVLMQNADTIHLAVHGYVGTKSDPAFLELSRDVDHDGKLFADEIANIGVRADLVVLTACNSGVGTKHFSDERTGAIDLAFLRAGARAVVSTRWAVDDQATAVFIMEFYRRLLAGEGRLEAFSATQRDFRRGRLTDTLDRERVLSGVSQTRGVGGPSTKVRKDYTHPYYWTAFALRGDFR